MCSKPTPKIRSKTPGRTPNLVPCFLGVHEVHLHVGFWIRHRSNHRSWTILDLLSLLLLRTPLDLYAMFGLFMLIGIVKKNGILQIDKTNELRREGAKRDAAILEANFTRLRPILMTTVMLMAAMIPIAMGWSTLF
ncbi:MAG: efflux RND transporter permease subunit [Planctomycetota bacterium]